MRSIWPLAGLCVVSAALGCSSFLDRGPLLCTDNMAPGIIVEIRDGTDGHAIADLASGTVTDGAFSDSLARAEGTSPLLADLFSRQAASERAGTYRVHVDRPDYRSWDTAGVVVTADACHVRTVRLRANLTPMP